MATYGEAKETCGKSALFAEKAHASETPHHCKTADNCEATYRYETSRYSKTEVKSGSAAQLPNVAEGRSADRLLGERVLLNADRPGNSTQQVPQSRNRKRRPKTRADRHHQKIPSQLTRLSRTFDFSFTQHNHFLAFRLQLRLVRGNERPNVVRHIQQL